MSEHQLDNEQDEFEYNDGLGDLLREKERREFSWLKTVIVLITFIFVIFFCLTFLFNISKSIFMGDHGSDNQMQELEAQHADQQSFADQIAQIEKENMTLIGDIDDYLAEEKKAEQAKVATKKATVSAPASNKTSPAPTAKTTDTNVSGLSKLPYKVIAGSFTTRSNANGLVSQLKNMGVGAFIYTVDVKGTTYYRVQAGAFATKAEATKHVDDLKSKSISSYIIVK